MTRQEYGKTTAPFKTELRHDKTEAQQELFLTSALFSPDNKFVVTTSADKTVRVWDPMIGSRDGCASRTFAGG